MADAEPDAGPDPLDRAVRVLVGRYGCEAEEAGDMLARWAHETCLGVQDVARWLVDDADVTAGRCAGPDAVSRWC